MFRRKSARVSAVAASALLSLVMAAPVATTASAASKSPETPSSSVRLGWSSTSRVLRAQLFENVDGSGKVISVYGPGNCTKSHAAVDARYSRMPATWNDAVSHVADFNLCDVRLWEDVNFLGTTTGYVDYASGKNLSSYWNDNASSFELS